MPACDETERVIKSYRRVLEANGDKQEEAMRDFTFRTFGEVFTQLRELRARLPWRPWMLPALGVGCLGLLAAAIFWMGQLDMRTQSAVAATLDNRDTCEQLDGRQRQVVTGIVRLTADLNNLLRERGISPSTPEQRREVMEQLGLSPDLAEETPTLSGPD